MESLPYFTFKGHSSLDYGLLIVEKGSYKGAQRDITYTSIAGRSGDLIIDNGRYNNIKIPYKLSLINTTEWSFTELSRKIRGWLLAEQGYFQLTDSYDSDYFRLASYSDEVDIEQELRSVGKLSLSFNCKPFKYSFAGQDSITMTAAGTLTNAEQYESKPYIKVVGSGNITLMINGSSFLLSDIDGYIELDSEMMNAFKGTAAANSQLTADAFPIFAPGNNNISWVGNVNRLEIVPRWCCL